jgi:hypothetical protein
MVAQAEMEDATSASCSTVLVRFGVLASAAAVFEYLQEIEDDAVGGATPL